MLDNEKLLFDELYEKTKDCGRVQFVELLMTKERENKELNQKYLNAVADYETTMAEKEQLNSLVNSCQEEIRRLNKQLEEYKDKINWYENFKINKTIDKLRIKHNNQQKEFINYLEDLIKFYKNRDSYMVADILGSYDLNNIELELLEEILQKYKSIIGDDK